MPIFEGQSKIIVWKLEFRPIQNTLKVGLFESNAPRVTNQTLKVCKKKLPFEIAIGSLNTPPTMISETSKLSYYSSSEEKIEVEKDEHDFPQRMTLFHYGYNNIQDPIFQNRRDIFWIKIRKTAQLSTLNERVKVESICDSRAKIAYKDQDGAIYLPPFDKELQGITRIDYTNENNEKECSSCQTCQFAQDQTQNTARDIISYSDGQITLKVDSESIVDIICDGLPLEAKVDELGQPMYIWLTFYGYFKELPCYIN